MATKEVSALDQALITAIQKAQAVGGEVYDGAKAVTGKSIDFVVAQAPDLIHQLLVWHFAISLIYFLAALFSLIFATNLGIRIYKSLKPDGDHPLGVIFTVICWAIFIPLLFSNLEWLKIWLAPKLFLLEYVAGLLK